MSDQTDLPPPYIAELETRLAFQEKAIEDLSAVIYRQERRIEQLSNRLTQLQQKTSELASQVGEDNGGHEPPPHY